MELDELKDILSKLQSSKDESGDDIASDAQAAPVRPEYNMFLNREQDKGVTPSFLNPNTPEQNAISDLNKYDELNAAPSGSLSNFQSAGLNQDKAAIEAQQEGRSPASLDASDPSDEDIKDLIDGKDKQNPLEQALADKNYKVLPDGGSPEQQDSSSVGKLADMAQNVNPGKPKDTGSILQMLLGSGSGIGGTDPMRMAMMARNLQQNSAGWNQAGNIIAGAFARQPQFQHANPDVTAMNQQTMQNADQGVKDVGTQLTYHNAVEKDDPKSPFSKLARDAVNKMFPDLNVPDTVSASAIEGINGALGHYASSQATLAMAKLRFETGREDKDIARKLAAQKSLEGNKNYIDLQSKTQSADSAMNQLELARTNPIAGNMAPIALVREYVNRVNPQELAQAGGSSAVLTQLDRLQSKARNGVLDKTDIDYMEGLTQNLKQSHQKALNDMETEAARKFSVSTGRLQEGVSSLFSKPSAPTHQDDPVAIAKDFVKVASPTALDALNGQKEILAHADRIARMQADGTSTDADKEFINNMKNDIKRHQQMHGDESGMIDVIDPNGQQGQIPKANREKAIQLGYRIQ